MRWIVQCAPEPDGSQATESVRADRVQIVQGFLIFWDEVEGQDPKDAPTRAAFAPGTWLRVTEGVPDVSPPDDIPPHYGMKVPDLREKAVDDRP